MGLTEYRRKRSFGDTPEPRGKAGRSSKHRFVVQKHDATRLHYDFRLELDGVLKSWAVPKGPSLDPHEKRLAVQVEDHPIEYATFEGTIPEGHYGAGTVIVWDRGTWEPLDDAAKGLREGKLKFSVRGKKLRGGFTLVRLRGRDSTDGKNWLLIKERDDEARPLSEYDVLDEGASVATGRSLSEVATRSRRVWNSDRQEDKAASRAAKPSSAARASKAAKKPAAKRATKTPTKKTAARKPATRPRTAAKRTAKKKSPRTNPGDVPGARQAPLPAAFEPQLATLMSKVPQEEAWCHEIKLDGYRLLARVEHGRARLFTRQQNDWTSRFPTVARDLEQLGFANAIFDGEVVALESNGISSFQALQNAMREDLSGKLTYFVFDLLYLDGFDLRQAALAHRKQLLAEALTDAGQRIRYNEHFQGNGDEFLRQCCRLGLEGIITKRLDRPYRSGRSSDWLKIKCVNREEFVIGGFTEPTASRQGLGALLVGYFDRGKLVYSGKVGTGFSDRLLRELRSRLNESRKEQSPFSAFAGRKTPRGTHWVEPNLVAQVEFGNWTRDGLLRHPSFQGLREDKAAIKVTRPPTAPAPPSDERSAEELNMPNSNSKASAGNPKTGAAAKRSSSAKRGSSGKRGSPASGGQADRVEKLLENVRMTHPDRVLYPAQGVTKLGLAAYYFQVADWILPHLKGRPLSLVRCPEGEGTECFYQKHAVRGTPENLRRVPIEESQKKSEYVAVDDVGGLVSLAQMSVLEIHPWGSREDELERPDRLIFDLDPDAALPWSRVIEAAGEVRDFLAELGLESFVKTTGGKGLHVVAPIVRRHEWPAVKAFARGVAEAIAARSPERYLTKMSKAARVGRIFLDYLRNERGATAVAPYSTRAKPNATVSAPITWDELSPALRADHFNVENMPQRLASIKRDPWEGFFEVRQSLTAKIIAKVGA